MVDAGEKTIICSEIDSLFSRYTVNSIILCKSCLIIQNKKMSPQYHNLLEHTTYMIYIKFDYSTRDVSYVPQRTKQQSTKSQVAALIDGKTSDAVATGRNQKTFSPTLVAGDSRRFSRSPQRGDPIPEERASCSYWRSLSLSLTLLCRDDATECYASQLGEVRPKASSTSSSISSTYRDFVAGPVAT